MKFWSTQGNLKKAHLLVNKKVDLKGLASSLVEKIGIRGNNHRKLWKTRMITWPASRSHQYSQRSPPSPAMHPQGHLKMIRPLFKHFWRQMYCLDIKCNCKLFWDYQLKELQIFGIILFFILQGNEEVSWLFHLHKPSLCCWLAWSCTQTISNQFQLS